ncbi:tetratricopeptide repeat protein [Alteromonas sp. MMG017]|uniref:tetratricopeptide repeat protein n=1 Tax=Alteromonas sp. MMG017 TaxID=2822692 RepID=UPI001B3A56D1|nr:tetratricopeptide repeat protein [Alteromonas sp. MMG017]MBQ4830357.1 tetratricopeptide repeat protein [Alteromonas sp. MMG017]
MAIDKMGVLRQVVNAFQQGKYDYVIQFIGANPSILKLDPVAVQVYSSALRKTRDVARAESVIIKGLKTFKGSPKLLNSLGTTQLELGKAKNAVQSFKKALATNPLDVEVKYNLARAYKEVGLFNEAEAIFVDVIRKKTTYSQANIHLADVYVNLGALEKAQSCLMSTLETDPTNVVALNNLGNVLRKMNDFEASAQRFEAAIKLQPANSTLRRNLAATLVLLNRREEAKQCFMDAVSLTPLDWTAQEELASFLWEEGVESPFEYIEPHINQKGANTEFVLAYIKLLVRADQFQKALDVLNSQAELLRTSLDFYIYQARVYRELGDYHASLDYVEKGEKLKVKNSIGLDSEAGYTLLSLGRVKEAHTKFAKLVKQEPLNQGWWTMLSTCYYLQNEESKYDWLCNYQQLLAVVPVLPSKEGRQSLNNALRDVLEALHQNERHPIGQSLRNGTQTYENLFDDNNEVINTLSGLILDRAGEFIKLQSTDRKHPFLSRLSKDLTFKGSWSVKLRSDGYHRSHYHPEGWLSGVYYVDVPDAVNQHGEGWLTFGRADIANQNFEGDFSVKPHSGNLILFPSYMWHGTNAFTSSTARLTVAFDIIPSH